MTLTPRIVLLLLSLTLILPDSAFALRNQANVEGSGLEELTRALRFSEPVAFSKAVQLIQVPISPITSGMEERKEPERLGFKGWMATFGSWGPTKRALQQFDKVIRPALRGQINALVKLLVQQNYRFYSGQRVDPVHDVRTLLRNAIPAAAKSMNAAQFRDGIALAIREAEHEVDPYYTLHSGLPIAAQKLTPEQFTVSLNLANRLADRRIDPWSILCYGLPVIAKVSPTLLVLQEHLQIVERFFVYLKENGIDPASISQSFFEPFAEISFTSESFQAQLQVLEQVSINLIRFIEKEVHFKGYAPLTSGAALSAIIQASRTAEDFQINLQTMEQFINQLNQSHDLPEYYMPENWRHSVENHIQGNRNPEELQLTLRSFGELLRRLTTVDWVNGRRHNGVSGEQLTQLANQAKYLDEQGLSFRIEVIPEQGKWVEQRREYYEDYDDSYYGYGKGIRISYSWEKVYSMLKPQEIQLVPEGDSPVFTSKSLALEDGFLKSSGVLKIVETDYRGRERVLHLKTLNQVREWFGKRPMGEGIAFSLEGIGILPRYYPVKVLGQDMVIRVYEKGQELTLAPVDTIFVRGKIDEGLRYEVISRLEFETMIAPDKLRQWEISRPAVVQRSSAQRSPAIQAVSDEVTMEQMTRRNWLWKSLLTQGGELSQADVLNRISNLKQNLPWLLRLLEYRIPGLSVTPAVSLYVVGSWLWGRTPNDLDLIVVTERNQLFEVLKPQQVEGFSFPVHVRVVGLDTLNQAVSGQMVENYHRIRIDAMVLYGSATLIAGHDLFAKTPLPRENLPELAEHFEGSVQLLKTVPGLTDAKKQLKAERWTREIAAIKQFTTGLEEVLPVADGALLPDGTLKTRIPQPTAMLRDRINLLPEVQTEQATLGVIAGPADPHGWAYGVALLKRSRTATHGVIPVIFLVEDDAQMEILRSLGVSPEMIFRIGSSEYPTQEVALRQATDYLHRGLEIPLANIIQLGVSEKISPIVEHV